MTTTQLETTVTVKELKGIPRKTAAILMRLINNHNVRYRIQQGGGHVFLYDGSQQTHPYKISASRPEETTLRYLNEWIEEHVPAYFEREVTATDVEMLREAVSTSEVIESRASAQERNTPGEPYIQANGIPSGFNRDGNTFHCRECGFSKEGAAGLHLHTVAHRDPEELARRARAAGESRKLNNVQNKTNLSAAFAVVADALGFQMSDSEEVAALKAEVADLKAKLALIKEAMRA